MFQLSNGMTCAGGAGNPGPPAESSQRADVQDRHLPGRLHKLLAAARLTLRVLTLILLQFG